MLLHGIRPGALPRALPRHRALTISASMKKDMDKSSEVGAMACHRIRECVGGPMPSFQLRLMVPSLPLQPRINLNIDGSIFFITGRWLLYRAFGNDQSFLAPSCAHFRVEAQMGFSCGCHQHPCGPVFSIVDRVIYLEVAARLCALCAGAKREDQGPVGRRPGGRCRRQGNAQASRTGYCRARFLALAATSSDDGLGPHRCPRTPH